MTFEIPQKLKYEEKIVFKLTAKQLFYLFIFAPIALFILLKTPLDLNTRISLSLIPSLIGALFMFTKVPILAYALLKWLPWRTIKTNPTSKAEKQMASFLSIEINEGVLHIK